MLTLYDKAKHLIQDLTKLLSNPYSVTSDEYKRRLSICETCPLRRENSCGLCGCNLTLKATKQVWTCPAGYWGDTPVQPEEPPAEFEVDRLTGCIEGARTLKDTGERCPGWKTCSLRRLQVRDNGTEVELLPICTLEGRKFVSSETCKTCDKSVI